MNIENYILKLTVAPQYQLDPPKSEEEIKNTRKVLSAEIIGKLELGPSADNENKKILKQIKCTTNEIIENCTTLDIRSPYAWALDFGRRDKNKKQMWKNVILSQKYWILECPREMLEKKVIPDDDMRYYAGLCRMKASDFFQSFGNRYPAYYSTPGASSENCIVCIYKKNDFTPDEKKIELKNVPLPITRFVFIKDEIIDRIYGPFRWCYSSGKLILEAQTAGKKSFPGEYQINVPYRKISLGDDTYEIASFYGARISNCYSDFEEHLESELFNSMKIETIGNLIEKLNKDAKLKRKPGNGFRSIGVANPSGGMIKVANAKTSEPTVEKERPVVDIQDEKVSENQDIAAPDDNRSNEVDTSPKAFEVFEELEKLANSCIEAELENATEPTKPNSTSSQMAVLDPDRQDAINQASADVPSCHMDMAVEVDIRVKKEETISNVLPQKPLERVKSESVVYSATVCESKENAVNDSPGTAKFTKQDDSTRDGRSISQNPETLVDSIAPSKQSKLSKQEEDCTKAKHTIIQNFEAASATEPRQDSRPHHATHVAFTKRESVAFSGAWKEPESVLNPDVLSLIKHIYHTIHDEYGNRSFSMADTANIMLCISQNLLTIITGRPGCGKTTFVRQLAKSLGLTRPEFNRFHEVHVGSDWRSERDLIGYYNPVNGRFEGTSLYRSLKSYESFDRNHHYPYWVLLDDANMSPLEGYLSDFRGILDTELLSKPFHRIETGVNLSGQSDGIEIPSSLRFIATFGDDYSRYHNLQVLSRAWIVSLPEVSNWDSIFTPITEQYKDSVPVSQTVLNNLCMTGITELGTDKECGVCGLCYNIYCNLLDILKLLDIKLQKGAWISIRRYCYAAKKFHLMLDETAQSSSDDDQIILDYVVSQRILPMIHRSGNKYRTSLRSVQDKYSSLIPNSSALIADIIDRSNATGFYSFFDRH